VYLGYCYDLQAKPNDSSHPNSVNYAKHWTSDEVIKMFSPDQKSVDSVRQWLADFGIDNTRIKHSDNKGWLAFDATTDEVEVLLHTEYHLYEHKSRHVTPACERYEIFFPETHIQRDNSICAYIRVAITSRAISKSISTISLPESNYSHPQRGLWRGAALMLLLFRVARDLAVLSRSVYPNHLQIATLPLHLHVSELCMVSTY